MNTNRSDQSSAGTQLPSGPLFGSIAQKNLKKFNKYLTNPNPQPNPAPIIQPAQSYAIVDLGIEDTQREANNATAPLPKSPSTIKKPKPPNDQQSFNVILAHIAKRQKTIRNQTLWQNLLRTDNNESATLRGSTEGKRRNPSQQSMERSVSKKKSLRTKQSNKQSLDQLFLTYATMHGTKKSQSDLDQTFQSTATRQSQIHKKLSKSLIMKQSLQGAT